MRAAQWRTLSDRLLEAIQETTTEYDYVPAFGEAYVVAVSELKKAERKDQEEHAHRP